MRTPLLVLMLAVCTMALAQKNDIGWIAPEGKIINYRTLTWEDFLGKEDAGYARQLAQRGLQARAYVSPAIYITPDGHGEYLPNGKLKFKFTIKCAFQSHAFARNSTRAEHSNYVLTHEQDHYDIALTYARKIHDSLVNREYSDKTYMDEIKKIYYGMLEAYDKVQEKYDGEVNPNGTDNIPMQDLWDMRIKRGLDLATIDLYNAPESSVQIVKAFGVMVKKLPEDDLRRFCTRARPLYTEFHDENAAVSREVNEWLAEPCTIAFYTQRYYIEEDGKPVKDCSRMLGYMFIPNGNGMYKRTFIDTFCVDDKAPRITGVFFANADSDGVRELVIQTAANRKDKQANGTLYSVHAYDNVSSRPFPGRLKRLDISPDITEGFEGTMNGKAQKAKYKTEKEISEALVKAGFSEIAAPKTETKRVIRR